MARIKLLAAAAIAALGSVVNAQAGPNTLAQYNPSKRTMSANSTFCIVPIPKADVKAITGFDALDVPASILPTFPDGMHPLIVSGGYENDIRMTALDLVPLQIPSLTQASLIVPYADATKDGITPIGAPVNYYIGGTNGNFLEALVPSIAGAVPLFEGTNIAPAIITPDTAAVQSLPNGIYSLEAKPYLLPNPVSGPGLVANAFDILYSLTDDSPYTEHTFHSLLNIPQLLNNGKCQRNMLYFNESFADPKMAVGSVTLYHQLLFDTPPAEIEGHYTDVYCYQANGELVGSVGEKCSDAAARVDPDALE